MKPTKLLPFVIVLGILAALVWMQKSSDEPPSIIEETSLAELLPSDLEAKDIQRLEFYSGDKPDERLVLERKGSKGPWVLPGRFDGVVDEEKIEDLLKDLTKLKGEYRSKADTDAQLADYELGDEEAFHVEGFKKADDKALFHLLSGKSPSYNNVFMRKDGGKEIYVADVDVQQQSNMKNTTVERAAPRWLKKKVLENDKEKLTRIALSSPDRSLVFEKREKPVEEEEAKDEEGAPEIVSVKLPEFEWVLSQAGAAGTTYKDSALENIKRAIAKVDIEDVVDPAKLAEWGLDKQAFKCVASFEGSEDVVLEFARPDFQQSGYLRITSSDDSHVYKVRKYYLEDLFPKGNALFDLPKLTLKQDDISRIEMEHGDEKVVIVKQGGDWKVDSPVVDLDVQTTTINTLARTLATWKSDDYADSDAASGFDAGRTIRFTAGTETHTIVIGNKAQGAGGSYAKLDDNDMVLVMGKSDVGKVAIPLRDFFALALFDFDAEDVKSFSISRGGQFSQATRQADGQWELAQDAADKAVCDAAAEALSELDASDIMFGQTTVPSVATFAFTLEDGTTDRLIIGPAEQGKHRALLESKKLVVMLDAADVAALLPDRLQAPEVKEAASDSKTKETSADAGSETKTDEASVGAGSETKEASADAGSETKTDEASVGTGSETKEASADAGSETKTDEASVGAGSETKEASADVGSETKTDEASVGAGSEAKEA